MAASAIPRTAPASRPHSHREGHTSEAASGRSQATRTGHRGRAAPTISRAEPHKGAGSRGKARGPGERGSSLRTGHGTQGRRERRIRGGARKRDGSSRRNRRGAPVRSGRKRRLLHGARRTRPRHARRRRQNHPVRRLRRRVATWRPDITTSFAAGRLSTSITARQRGRRLGRRDRTQDVVRHNDATRRKGYTGGLCVCVRGQGQSVARRGRRRSATRVAGSQDHERRRDGDHGADESHAPRHDRLHRRVRHRRQLCPARRDRGRPRRMGSVARGRRRRHTNSIRRGATARQQHRRCRAHRDR
mmetsp:Transcript_52084/g.173860  ORF Transcript_52084/g.173860 Transcript_52084/m.173860 type:complete len:303 (+) Transcript_52084:460-1368(+)